jgi:mono/diheme cytochrome c family protein
MFVGMSAPMRRVAAVLIAAALATPVAYGAATATTPKRLDGGKKLYRKFCGQCHALREARAVGFGIGGTAKSRKGEVDLGGPSFDKLRVTILQSQLAITGVWDGHSKVMTIMTHPQIKLVSQYIAAATRDHKYRATLPSDTLYG